MAEIVPEAAQCVRTWDTGVRESPMSTAQRLGMRRPAAPATPRQGAKPRLLQDGRDMFWSLAPLVVACIVLAGLVGMCSFRPSGPADGAAPGV